jgi:hypothetical protein
VEITVDLAISVSAPCGQGALMGGAVMGLLGLTGYGQGVTGSTIRRGL